jgi:hypothetical protein
MSNIVEDKPKDFFEVVIDKVKEPYDAFKEICTDLEYLKILDTDTEEIIDQKEKDAKAKKTQITGFRTSIQKIAKSERDGFNKASKEIIVIEKQFTSEIIGQEDLLKETINYRKLRAEKISNELHESRAKEIQEYEGFYNPIFFGAMVHDQWLKTLESAKLSKEAHLKEEEARVEREKAHKEEAEKLRAENLRLKQEAEKRQTYSVEEENANGVEEKPEATGTIQSEPAGGELQQLLNGINDLINKTTAPTDPKTLAVHKNAINLLVKTRGYIEFNL